MLKKVRNALMWTITGLLGGVLIALYNILPLIIAPLSVIFALIILKKKQSVF
ncbi:MAG: hypothetical protein V4496_00405 [Pseudomonadota bacterium]